MPEFHHFAIDSSSAVGYDDLRAVFITWAVLEIFHSHARNKNY